AHSVWLPSEPHSRNRTGHRAAGWASNRLGNRSRTFTMAYGVRDGHPRAGETIVRSRVRASTAVTRTIRAPSSAGTPAVGRGDTAGLARGVAVGMAAAVGAAGIVGIAGTAGATTATGGTGATTVVAGGGDGVTPDAHPLRSETRTRVTTGRRPRVGADFSAAKVG